MRGFCGIGVYQPKIEANIGSLWRHAFAFGANYIFTIGQRYKRQKSDTNCTHRHIPLFNYNDINDFLKNLPHLSTLVCIEIAKESRCLNNFIHPQQAIYLLGAEDYGLPESLLKENITIQIETTKELCLNVATAGSIVLYDRHIKGLQK